MHVLHYTHLVRGVRVRALQNWSLSGSDVALS